MSNDLWLSHGLDLGAAYHFGIVVYDLDDAIRRHGEAFGIRSWRVMEALPGGILPFWHGEPQPGVRQRFAYSNTPSFPWIELTQPLSDVDWPAAVYLRERGEGIYHAGFFVDDLPLALRQVEERGLSVSYRILQSDAGERAASGVAFLDPKGLHGLCVELVAASGRERLERWVRTGVWESQAG